MKRFFKIFAFVLVLLAIIAALYALVAPLVKEELIGFFGSLFENAATTVQTDAPKPPLGTTGPPNTPNSSAVSPPSSSPSATQTAGTPTTTAAPTTATAPTTSEFPDTTPSGNINIAYEIYIQDPESGLYHQKTELRVLQSGESKTFTPDIPEHYQLNEEKSRLTVQNASVGDSVAVYLDCLTCKVYFDIGEATLLDGYAIQTIRRGQTPLFPTLSRTGYSLTGYDHEPTPLYADTVIKPIWTLTDYVLRLYLPRHAEIEADGFTALPDIDGYYEKHFTVLDSIGLPTPIGEGFTFLGWNTADDASGESMTAIAVGTAQDLTLYAITDSQYYTLSFAPVDGLAFTSYYLPYGEAITAPEIPPEAQKPGYGILWYSDPAMTALYEFSDMPSESLTLYGRWEEDTGAGFLSWDKDRYLQSETVDSLTELADFIDFVCFYDFSEAMRIEVTYADAATVRNDIEKAMKLCEFRTSCHATFTFDSSGLTHPNAKCYLTMQITKSFRDVEATKTTDPSNVTAYTFLTEQTIPRGDSYTDFYIDALPHTYSVSTSNQLMYVVEHGYRPIPLAGSPAEALLNEAKAVLNSILPAEASEYDKIEAIFNWLIQEIEYDINAYELNVENDDNWPEYDAFFLEGALLKRKAVCDGIAKAFSLLCNIEGIPCVEIVGNGHAWNRVKLNNAWYVVDATFGNLQLGGTSHSVANHAEFLISDAEKTAEGYIAYNYHEIEALENYGYFDKKDIILDRVSFDYIMDSTDELSRLLEYVLTLSEELDNTTVNIRYNIAGRDIRMAITLAKQRLLLRGIFFDATVETHRLDDSDCYVLIFDPIY